MVYHYQERFNFLVGKTKKAVGVITPCHFFLFPISTTVKLYCSISVSKI